ncbi:MAG TPA: hypothetical protein VG502_18225 [Flexivirga sp.]|nr:hypothetical protein [Flexivirga sp.]
MHRQDPLVEGHHQSRIALVTVACVRRVELLLVLAQVCRHTFLECVRGRLIRLEVPRLRVRRLLDRGAYAGHHLAAASRVDAEASRIVLDALLRRVEIDTSERRQFLSREVWR